ncbi:acetamidase/formamidase family protein [Pullulanibacillus sp. KACC 23026]|uniref:acetamidase/formamidase family protein n=1 Tax=Pullulanibacillus sp. KACC 23026 TaxID=3028315 RepID=UPI0023B18C72|nr:acetamidase/formamidase family protein [Pullulanibacillus sp. KACC 23026]WEG14617.1 acetamidase/formamidase family protein [Pullulanibacillus sp. KACC 23026]
MTIHQHQHLHHTIHDMKSHMHYGWDRDNQPILEIEPGQSVGFEIIECSGGQLSKNAKAEDLLNFDFEKLNPVSGPLYVKGAEPGDTLEIDILDFRSLEWGWTGVIPGFGLLADEFKEPLIKTYDLTHRNKTEFLPGIDLFIKPFPGTIGVALPEHGHFNVVPPRKNGGNLDIRHLTRGTKLYLPVWVEGALFSVGDTHAAQGDGEVCGTAIEASMEINLRFKLHKGKQIQEARYEIPGPPTPEADSRGYYVTTGHGEDLFKASQNAIRYMIEYLMDTYGLTAGEAYMLCSVAVDLRINEIVDAPNWLVSAFLPRAIFN